MSETSNEKPLKILVSGDVEGKLNELYAKVKSIQSKVGKFDFLFCVGEFFGETPEDNKEIEQFCADPSSIPIQTYVLGTNKKSREKYFIDKSGYDICSDKIIYLGEKGYYSTFQGLSLVYLSGLEGVKKDSATSSSSKKLKSDKTEDETPVEFNVEEVEGIVNNLEKRHPGESIDLLLTNQWPMYVEKLSDQESDETLNTEKFGSQLVSYLATKIRPRYHFSATQNLFFERIPYRNHRILHEKEKHLTRFLALAKVNKPNKPKYLYAFNLTPSKNLDYREIIKHSAANLATDSPYGGFLSLTNEGLYSHETESINNSFFYDNDYIKKMNELNEKRANKLKRQMEREQNKEQEPCWFCLGGSKIERQYIISVGDKCYLSYAKGALNKDHLLIIPIDHVQSSIQCDQESMQEIEKFKQALKDYFKSKNKCVIFFERNFRTSHMQIQVFALKIEKSYLLKDAFLSAAKEQGINLNEIPEYTNLQQVLGSTQSFFSLELPTEPDIGKRNEKPKDEDIVYERFLSQIRGSHFPLSFGRDVIASEILLNCPERIDWKKCVKSLEEEKEMSLQFRNDFKKFDPSL